MKLRRAPLLLVTLAAALVLFSGVAALAAAQTSERGLGVLEDIPDGHTGASQLDDGTPVYVHRDGDERHVLGALSARSHLLVWCADAPGFVEPGSAFTFDAEGRVVFGGSPHGMFRYASEVRDGRVVVTGELPPAPRYEPGEATTLRGPESCIESEGDRGGFYHPISAEPVPLGELRFDGGWHAVEGFLDLDRQPPVLCAAPMAEHCPLDGDGVLPVVSTSAQQSPVIDEAPPGRYDGVFVVRAAVGGTLHDVAIVQHLDSRDAAETTGPWPYLTEYVYDEEEAAQEIPLRRYVVGEVAEFARHSRGYRITFARAAITEAEGAHALSPDGRTPAPKRWIVDDRIDYLGVYDEGEGGDHWLASPQELMDRVAQGSVHVAGEITDDGAQELTSLHILPPRQP